MLVNKWVGGHQLKQRGPVPSSVDETQTVNSQDRGFFKNRLDESPKAEMTSDEQDGQNILKKGTNGSLKKRGDRNTKRKQTQRKNAKTKWKLQNGYRQNEKRKSSKKHRKKEKAQVKVKGKNIKKPRKKPKKENKRANQKKRVIEGRQEKEASCEMSLRDSECFEKWASYTSVALAQAPIVIKQVSKFFHNPSSQAPQLPEKVREPDYNSSHFFAGQFHPRQ